MFDQLYIQAGQTIKHPKKLYLDTKFWIHLRDRDTSESASRLYSAIRKKVKSKELVCPTSPALLRELVLQEDVSTLRQTSKLMDEFSCGISFNTQEAIIGTEIAHLFNKLHGNEVHELEDLVWGLHLDVFATFLPETLKNLFLSNHGAGRLHSASIEEIVFDLKFKEFPRRNNVVITKTLNRDIEAYAHEVTSFSKVFESEAVGIADVFSPIFPEIIRSMALKEGVFDGGFPTQREIDDARSVLATVLLKSPQATKLRTMYILSSMHAAVRWDKYRKFKANDLPDFIHAANALGYCDYFFTEKSLKSLVEQKHIALDKVFDCKIESDINAAIDVIMNS